MVAGLRAADGREADKPSLWWGGREVEEPQTASRVPWAREGVCLASLGTDAGHPYSLMRQRQPDG